MWDPADPSPAPAWAALIDAATVVVNLAGANPGARRWNDSALAEIRDSRLEAIAALGRAVRAAKSPPRAFLQSSAVGVYGHGGTVPRSDDPHNPIGEAAEAAAANAASPLPAAAARGSRFRMDTCRAIEAACVAAVAAPGAGKPPVVVALRFGHVLAAREGLLPWLALAAAAGTTRIGSGTQSVPWVHVDDAAAAVAHVINDVDNIATLFPAASPIAVNVVVPTPSAQTDFLGALRGVPTSPARLLPAAWAVAVPAAVFAVAVGPGSSVVLDSCHATADVLKRIGFHWRYVAPVDAVRSLACQDGLPPSKQ